MDEPDKESGRSDAKAAEQLLIEAAQADPRQFAAIYEANFERVYAFVVRRVRDRSTAEDVTADVFQQALANLKKFEWRGVPIAAWLYRIASNAIADHFQKQGRTADSAPPAVEHPDLTAVEHRATAVPARGCTSRRPEAGDRHAIRRGEEHSRDRGTAGAQRRSRQATSIQRTADPQAADGAEPWLSWISSNASTRRWTRCSESVRLAAMPRRIRSWPCCSSSRTTFAVCPIRNSGRG